MIRHEYETIYVTRPDLDEADQARIDEKLQAIISNGNGEILVFETWGRRRLAYNIRRQQQGTYQYLHYVAPAELPNELERNMNLEDSLIRYLTVKLAEEVDPEAAREGAAAQQERRVGRLGLVPEEDESSDDEDTGDDDSSDDDSAAGEDDGDGADDADADATDSNEEA